jgi:NADH dehydrogenase (ubiquinone) 1 beta subcomplex subunit 9
VMRLYRAFLRVTFSWTEDRDIWFEEATKIRAEFDKHKHFPVESREAAELLKQGQAKLAANVHPDPYIMPYMPGGSLFMRNSPLPLEAIFPDGIPADVDQRQVNIDFSNMPAGQKYADKAFVDSISKQYWIDK